MFKYGFYLFKTDVYSYGMVLYEMFCGKVPFEGMTRNQVFYT